MPIRRSNKRIMAASTGLSLGGGVGAEPFVPMSTFYSPTDSVLKHSVGYYSTDPTIWHPFSLMTFTEMTAFMVYRPTFTRTNTFSLQNPIAGFSGGSSGGNFRVSSNSWNVAYHVNMQKWPASSIYSATKIDSNLYGHWFCLMTSWKVTGNLKHAWLVDLDTGIEYDLSPSGTVAAIAWNKTYGSSDQNMSFACANGSGTTTFSEAFTGHIGQSCTHDVYLDLSVSANRRLICALDGVVNHGYAGVNVFGEDALFYSPRGYPFPTQDLDVGNQGTTAFGDIDDYFASQPWAVGFAPPLPS